MLMDRDAVSLFSIPSEKYFAKSEILHTFAHIITLVQHKMEDID